VYLHSIAAFTQNAILAAPAPVEGFARFFKYDPTVKASELLTACSILLAFSTLTTTLWSGIRDRRDAHADKIRAAAANGLSKLERWCRLSLRYYADVQPILVEISEQLGDGFDVDKARDTLWKALTAARVTSVDRILAESIESAYVELSSVYPGAYGLFTYTLHSLENVDELAREDLLLCSQEDVTSYRDDAETFTPAALGNSLRETCHDIQENVATEMERIAGPLRAFLVEIIKSSGSQILSRRTQSVEIPAETLGEYPGIFVEKDDSSRVGKTPDKGRPARTRRGSGAIPPDLFREYLSIPSAYDEEENTSDMGKTPPKGKNPPGKTSGQTGMTLMERHLLGIHFNALRLGSFPSILMSFLMSFPSTKPSEGSQPTKSHVPPNS
jgi:hypothetical protein